MPRAEIVHDTGDEHQPGAGATTGKETSGGGETVGGGELTSNHVQRELAKLADVTRLRRLEADLEAQGNYTQCTRLRELRHPEVSHASL